MPLWRLFATHAINASVGSSLFTKFCCYLTLFSAKEGMPGNDIPMDVISIKGVIAMLLSKHAPNSELESAAFNSEFEQSDNTNGTPTALLTSAETQSAQAARLLLESSEIYRSQASGFRISSKGDVPGPRASTPSLASSSNSRHATSKSVSSSRKLNPNLKKAQDVLAERKLKHSEAMMKGHNTGVKVSATIWMVTNLKLVQVFLNSNQLILTVILI